MHHGYKILNKEIYNLAIKDLNEFYNLLVNLKNTIIHLMFILCKKLNLDSKDVKILIKINII